MASYVDSNLSAGEVVVFRTKLHWLRYVWGWAVVVLLVLGGSAGKEGGNPAMGPAILIALVLALATWLQRSSSELAVTSRRAIIKVGLLQRQTIEMNLEKIESILVHQGILGRLLGYGTLVVRGTGGTGQPFPAIANALGFRKAVNEATEARRPAGG